MNDFYKEVYRKIILLHAIHDFEFNDRDCKIKFDFYKKIVFYIYDNGAQTQFFYDKRFYNNDASSINLFISPSNTLR